MKDLVAHLRHGVGQLQRGSLEHASAEKLRVVNEVEVILPEPVLELVQIERTVTDPGHERVRVLGLPDIIGDAAKVL